MDLLVFGHGGARVLVFPTSMGRFFEWEDLGMIGALREHLERGWLQLFCVDSVDAESWYARGIAPADRARRHTHYDHYLHDEVLPFTKERNPNPFLLTTGASFGAYHAVNFGLRHPDLVDRVIGMSGLYDIKGFTDGYSDDYVYFNNPADFIPHEHDPGRLGALRHDGHHPRHRARRSQSSPATKQLSALLWDKGIGTLCAIWDGWAHDWPYWREMIRTYIGGHD